MTNIEKWNFWLRELESPQVFIDFTAYWIVSSALQRRVWYGDYRFSPMFPNLYTVFVGPPGVGKSMAARLAGSKILKTFRLLDANKIRNGVEADKAFTDVISFSADNTTEQSLIQQLNKSTKSFDIPIVTTLENGTVVKSTNRVQQASMSMLLSEEMTSLFKQSNENISSFLNQCWDAQDYHYKTKTQGEDLIKNVCVTLLGCTTPDKMKKLVASGVLEGGFTARAIPLYCEEPRHKKFKYVFTKEQWNAFEEFKKHIENLTKVSGEVTFSPDAEEFFKSYYEAPKGIKSKMETERVNFDKRTDDYYGRKKTHIYKMAMLLHFMEHIDTMEIPLVTLKQAIDILHGVEADMHKALASAGNNPLFEYYRQVYDTILEYSQGKSGGITLTQLKLLYGENLDELKLQAVIKWLGETNKIHAKVVGTRMLYLPVEAVKIQTETSIATQIITK